MKSLRWLWLIPVALTAASMVMVGGPYGQIAKLAPPFDEKPAPTGAEVAARLDALGAAGRELYRTHFYTDLAFVGANAVALLTPIVVFARRLRLPRTLAYVCVALPLGFAAADWAENVAVARILDGDQSMSRIAAAAYATQVKFALFGAAALTALLLAASWCVARLLGRDDAAPQPAPVSAPQEAAE